MQVVRYSPGEFYAERCIAVDYLFANHLLCSSFLQVVRYNPGEFYAEHYDNKVGGRISRAATIIIYLQARCSCYR